MRADRGITATELAARVRARFPDLDVLADGREPTHVVLEDALQAARFDLRHNDEAGRLYFPVPKSTGPWSSTGSHTSMLPPVRAHLRRVPADPHGALRERLAESAHRGGFLALTVKVVRLPGTAETVAARFPVVPVDLGALFLREFRRLTAEKGQDWQVVLRADAASAPGRIKPGLATFVRVVWQRVVEHLDSRASEPRTVLFLHDAGLVSRYWDEGGRAFLVALQAAARTRARTACGCCARWSPAPRARIWTAARSRRYATMVNWLTWTGGSLRSAAAQPHRHLRGTVENSSCRA
ncbi:hypothetical protein AB0932_28740 [Streptomyces sp. NPDC006682]|uniref:hypothetical protein n=1 Tax=unclassified Streptomyces TaxID=2593676 RepID=UPI0034557143